MKSFNELLISIIQFRDGPMVIQRTSLRKKAIPATVKYSMNSLLMKYLQFRQAMKTVPWFPKLQQLM